VKLFDMETGKIVSYVLAGPVEFELEIYPSIVTFTAPLGKGLIGKKIGEVAKIELPKHTAEYLVLDIEPATKSEEEISPNLLILGHIGHDIIHVDDKEEGKFHGGPAYHTAVAASCFSDRAAIISALGKDDKELHEAAKALECFTDGIKLFDDYKSPEFKLYHPSDPKKKSTDWNKNDEISLDGDSLPGNISPDYYKAKYLHIAAAPPEQQLKWINDIKAEGKYEGTFSVDVSEKFVGEDNGSLIKVFEQCEFVFAGENGFKLMDKIDIEEKVIILRKNDGGTELWIDGELQLDEKAPEKASLDTTGYTGVLAGAFLALVSLGVVEEIAFEVASRVAGMSLDDFGVEHLLDLKAE
ncbi:MAG: hypothetical protein GF310_14775, partial [candidate division Zixibacteria bacterium]|nr:hypothetical protein [candidate division Zixibacteria bacterium]